MSRQADIKKLIHAHDRRMQLLKEQKAIQGVSVDPQIIIEIEDIEAELEKLEAKLKEIEEGAAASPQINSSTSSDVHEKTQRTYIQPPLFPEGGGVYIPRLRPWALVGMIIVPLIAISVLFFSPVQNFIATTIFGPASISENDSRFSDHLQEIWNNLDKENNLGNLVSEHNRSSYSRQLFEGGVMLWWDPPNSLLSTIWVIEVKGDTNEGIDWASYDNTWFSGEDVFPPGCPEPQGPYGPELGFGKIWCDHLTVREELGKAVDTEYADDDAIVQFYSKGIKIYIPEFKEIWVLYYDGNWTKFD